MKNFLIFSLFFFQVFNYSIAENVIISAEEQYVNGDNYSLNGGDTIFIEASTKGYLKFFNFHGELNNPLVFINKGGQVKIINSNHPYNLAFENCSYFKLTGSGVDGLTYGFLIDGKNYGSANGLSLSHKCTNYDVGYLEIKNTGFSGVMSKSEPRCDLTTNRGNFIQESTYFHHLYIHDINGEGFYVGHSYYNGIEKNCDGSSTVLFPHLIKDLKIYENIIKNTKYDGIQVSCAIEDCWISSNKITNYGSSKQTGQISGIQIGAGTTGLVYNNFIKDGGDGIFCLGKGNNLIYNNVVVNAGGYFANDPSKNIKGIFLDDRDGAVENEYHACINNTIINPHTSGIRFNSDIMKNYAYNNVIVLKNGAEDYQFITINNSQVDATLSNNHYTTDINTLNFVGEADYNLTAESPLVDAGKDVSSWGVEIDYNNHNRPQGTSYDIGAYELMEEFGILKIEEENNLMIFPNPFQENLSISYELKYPSFVKIELFNLLGEKLDNIISKKQNTGVHFISNHNYENIQTGVYLLKIKIDEKVILKKVLKF